MPSEPLRASRLALLGGSLGTASAGMALAGAAGDVEELVSESADLLYHLIVMLKSRDLSLRDVAAELRRRHDDAVARGA